MDDYISREEVLELIDNAPIIAGSENETLISAPELSDKVYCLPAADMGKNTDGLTTLIEEAVRMAELKPCPFCGRRLIEKSNHSRLPSGKVIDYTYWTHEDSRDCILGAILTERKGHFLLESDIEQWNRRDGNG